MAAAAAATTAATAARRRQRHTGLHHEAHVGQVYFDGLNLIEKRALNAEPESTFFKRLVLFVRLIQSQCQPGAASAAGSQVDANAATFLALKVRFKLFAGAVSQLNHTASKIL